MAKHKHGPRKSVDIITTKQRTIWIIRGMYCLSLASLHPHVFWAGQSNVGLLFTATAEQQAGTHHTDELKYNNIGGLKQDQQENSSSATITIYELICFEETWIYIYIFCFLQLWNGKSCWSLPHGRQGLLHHTKSVSWLLMIWRCQELGHQQQWYWPNSLMTFWPQHQKGWKLTSI